MRALMCTCILAALAAPGCAVQYMSRAGSGVSSTSAQVSVSSGTVLGNAVIVGIILGDAVQYYRLGPDGGTPVPAPEPDLSRTINIQDCTRAVDPSAGNLMCR